MTVIRLWRLKVHSAIARIQRLCLLNSRSPSPVGIFHSWPDFRKNDLRDICARLRRLGSFFLHGFANVAASQEGKKFCN